MKRSNMVLDGTVVAKEDEHLEHFYEEQLDKQDYDEGLIQELFLKQKIRITQETRHRYSREDYNTRVTTTIDLTGTDMDS